MDNKKKSMDRKRMELRIRLCGISLASFVAVPDSLITESMDIQQEAIEQIYVSVKGDMRQFKAIYNFRMSPSFSYGHF